ncbi:molybdopterin converting factor [Bordetella ansorpii]|uniref:Molybdopterin synthase sulfur carrier subunit n=1 Tax=Bordetella ansorpii TaxID=288768 RepID=A0A157PB39_9BORD|nr:MoaD/ThiS family protein [Bordetella ansorpii]SAI30763.1 molybdopterin converting factor [Bordetella ansorpii]
MNGATVNLLYFARVAELIGKRSESWPISGATTGAQLLAELQQRYPQLGPSPRLRLAINQEHAKSTVPVQPGDEVAIFEPVTGG